MKRNPHVFRIERLEQRRLLSSYTITDLGEVAAAALNDNGAVVGTVNNQGFLRSNGKMQTVGAFPLGTTWGATDINDAGQIIIGASSSVDPAEAYLDTGGTLQDLGPQDPAAINSSGQVVLNVHEIGGCSLYTNGSKQSIGSGLVGYDVNNAGVVVGGGFAWSAATGVLSLPYLNILDQSEAFGVNNNDAIVGQSAGHAFLWTEAGGIQDLGVLPIGDEVSQYQSSSLKINDAGYIVGYASGLGLVDGIPETVSDAIIDFDGTMTDLNTLIPGHSGFTLTQAIDINNSGQILVDALDSQGNQHSLLLTPGSGTGGGTGPGTINGMVFNDVNGNGAKERRDTGMSGISVTLQKLKRGRPTGRASSTTTNRKGDYSFTGIASGTYRVSETVPRGYKQTAPTSGSYTLSLSAGQTLSGENFGDHASRKVHSAFIVDDLLIQNNQPSTLVGIGDNVDLANFNGVINDSNTTSKGRLILESGGAD